MAVVRWDPLRDLADMSERLNRVVSQQGKIVPWMGTVRK